ncbi:Fungal trans, partial [Geosmithia morbida]
MERRQQLDTADSPGRPIRSRTSNACDGCKKRKVKCDGNQPCSYCARRQRPHTCKYTAPSRIRQRRSRSVAAAPSPAGNARGPSPLHPEERRGTGSHGRDAATPSPPLSSHGRPRRSSAMMESAEDDTEVPREARLLCDAQGKLIFIGDCAPLSFFQSVRQLVNSRVGQTAFAPETSRYSVLENAPSSQQISAAPPDPPDVRAAHVSSHVASYVSATSGMLDLFDNEPRLTDNLVLWANLRDKPRNLTSAINYLILAIGCQTDDEPTSQVYFEYAKAQAFASLSDSLGVETVQAFVLVTVYMLCSCQINSSFLVFGVSVRAAYSIGVHRTEVNARFGPEIHRQRDRLWKSLRVIDLFLSTSMGRPPATSDVDCTVPYRHSSPDNDGGSDGGTFDLLNASVQILLITEGIVLEIFSRKRVSLQRTDGISLRLRQWSADWLRRLSDVVSQPCRHPRHEVAGACQVLSSYYYAVMLVSRPFLMYEVFRRLGDGPANTMASGKSKLADACIDAASLMVDPIIDLIKQGALDGRRPIIVSWLFAASLVLGLGLLSGFGRTLENHTQMSIQALEHFARTDAHARQYSLIAQSLLTTALEHLEKRELQQRLKRTETSSQLFGLIPQGGSRRTTIAASPVHQRHHQSSVLSPTGTTDSPFSALPSDRPPFLLHNHHQNMAARLSDMDSPAYLGLNDSLAVQDGTFWNMYQGTNEGDALNLFPLLDSGGAIDLAHYL